MNFGRRHGVIERVPPKAFDSPTFSSAACVTGGARDRVCGGPERIGAHGTEPFYPMRVKCSGVIVP
jgi:uncharacterized membrane protein